MGGPVQTTFVQALLLGSGHMLAYLTRPGTKGPLHMSWNGQDAVCQRHGIGMELGSEGLQLRVSHQQAMPVLQHGVESQYGAHELQPICSNPLCFCLVAF